MLLLLNFNTFHFLVHFLLLFNAFMQFLFFLLGSCEHFLHGLLVKYLFFAQLLRVGINCHHYHNALFGRILQLNQLEALQKGNSLPIVETAFYEQLHSIYAQVVAKLIDQALHWIPLHI